MPSTDKYHPFRYSQQRSFAKQIASYWQSNVGTNMVPTAAAVEGLQKILFRGYNETLEKLPFDKRPSNADLLFDEHNRAITYGVFCACGQNIFDFEQSLVEMFSKTDIGDIPASAIHLPFNMLYLSFGPQENLVLGTKWLVDGAYVFVQQFDDKVYLHVNISTQTLVRLGGASS